MLTCQKAKILIRLVAKSSKDKLKLIRFGDYVFFLVVFFLLFGLLFGAGRQWKTRVALV